MTQDLARASVDLMLIDIVMPGISGFDLIRELKADPGFSTPILVLSRQDEPDDIAKAMALGADSVVPKPIDPVTLLEKIRVALKGRGTPAAALAEAEADSSLKLAALKREYSLSLPLKGKAIGKAVRELLASGGLATPEHWGALRALIHQLSGSSGTYGIPGLFALAYVLEKSIKQGAFDRMKPEGVAGYLANWLGLFENVLEQVVRGHDLYLPEEVAAIYSAARRDLDSVRDMVEEMLDDDLESSSFMLGFGNHSFAAAIGRGLAKFGKIPSLAAIRIDWQPPAESPVIAMNEACIEKIVCFVLSFLASCSAVSGSAGAVTVRLELGEKSVTASFESAAAFPFDPVLAFADAVHADRERLGLIISRILAEKHGGGLVLATAASGESRVQLSLPWSGLKG